MLPNDTASSLDVPGRFLPTDAKKSGRLVDFERGGIAINDASQGHNVQDWKLSVVDNAVTLTPEIGSPTVLFSTAGISELSLAFDQNMRPVVGYIHGGVLKIRWYDGTIPGYRTDVYDEAQNPKLALDDKRTARAAFSDVIVAYIRNTTLYFRQQRDRFENEYTLEENLATNTKLRNIGMSRNWRLQFELG